MPYLVDRPFSNQYRVPIDFERDITEELRQTFWHNGDLLKVYNHHGLPLDPDIVPARARIRTKAKRLMDFIGLRFRYGVTEAFRQKVEELEPGVHQFFPVEITTRDGDPVEKTYYLMNVCNRVDAIDDEKSIIRWTGNEKIGLHRHAHFSGIPGGYGEDFDYKYRLVFKKEIVSGMCMWIDRRLSGTIISDELYDFVIRSKLKKLDARRVYLE